MTEAELVSKVSKILGILSDDADISNQIKARIYGVIGFINGGGGKINISSPSDYEILCISLGVSDLLIQKLPDYSPGFKAMAQQIMMLSKEEESDNG